MLSTGIQDAINDQIKHELASAYLYLSMSAYCEAHNLAGMARWLRFQWEEEQLHAMKLFDYVNERGGRVILQAIDKPAAEFQGPLDIFQHVLAHEQEVTSLINKLYALALKGNDYPTQVELQWFITEQVEEEKNAAAIVEQLKMVKENTSAMLMLDRQLGSRTKED
jgi:ferritin